MTRIHELRPIQKGDNAAMARIIREVMPEFGADGAGFAITDPEVDCLFEAYAAAGSGYFVVVADGVVAGGAGYGPLAGGARDVCELRKMYFLPGMRGLGLGRRMLALVVESARRDGYKKIYLETLGRMDDAGRLYLAAGFRALCSPMGDTGHCGCDSWYAMDL
ncbi:MAG: GNAT family N-acetyltransferase [Myxococcota bacterium]|jgi:putative acetyltransferase